MDLKGSRTAKALRAAFQAEAEAAARYLFFARRADIEGRADAAALLRSFAEGELGQAFGHLELLEETGDPLSGGGDTAANLEAVEAAEEEAAEDRYVEWAATARGEGFDDVAGWFAGLADAEAAHVKQLRRLRDAED